MFKLLSKQAIGGQAVIEGVMMRGQQYWAVAVRTPSGEIATYKEKLNQFTSQFPIFNSAIIRGVVVLIETVILGLKSLSYSARMSMGEDTGDFSTRELILTFILALILIVGLFMILPLYLARFSGLTLKGGFLFAFVEGVFRISIFLLYIVVISQLKDVKRVFQYHGAEHKTIHALEAGEELTPAAAAKYSALHLRCGTSFLLIVMVIAIFTFSFLPTRQVILRLLGKIILIPLIAGVSYEIIKYASKHSTSLLVKILMAPGLWLQKLTTREPDESQLEVAIRALQEALDVKSAAEVTIGDSAAEVLD
jgi:uncharacterized protein YqhQ